MITPKELNELRSECETHPGEYLSMSEVLRLFAEIDRLRSELQMAATHLKPDSAAYRQADAALNG